MGHWAGRSLSVASLLVSAVALASASGVTGRSGKSGATCSGCHTSTSGTAPAVTIAGPSTLAPGATAEYTLRVAGGPGTVAGMNVAVSSASAVLTAMSAAGTRKESGEITHVQPRPFSAGEALFQFKLTAPTVVGTLQLFGAGQSCNGTGTTAGDREGLTTFTVSVETPNAPPTIVAAATATPSPVTGVSTTVSALGADDDGEAALTYTWSSTSGPAAVTFSANGTNAAKSATATFSTAGTYTLQVQISDAAGQSVTSSVSVTVQKRVNTVSVTPNSAGVAPSGTQAFAATARDQFAQTIVPAPTFTWNVSGGGTISPSGLFTASAAPGGPYTVTATAGGKTGTAAVTVSAGTPPTVAKAAAAASNPVMTKAVALSVLGADDGGEAQLTYTWALLPGAPGPVTFSANGTNAAKNTTATFSAPGEYTFEVTLKDAVNLTANSSVTVEVGRRVATLTVTPSTADVPVSGTQSFQVVAKDQFGGLHDEPPAVAWSTSGGGTISTSGLFRAASTSGGPYTVTAETGTRSATAQVTVVEGGAPTFTQPPTAAASPVVGRSVALQTLATDTGGDAQLQYTWAATNGPGAVTFSSNGTHASKQVVATFSRAGSYTLEVTAQNAAGRSATATLDLPVQQTITSVTLSPESAQIAPGGTFGFSASVLDQFGDELPSSSGLLTWELTGGGSVDQAGVVTARLTPGGPFSVRANTAVGVRGTALFSVGTAAPDTVPPTLALLEPTEGAALSGTVRVKAEVGDDVGVAAVSFVVDGQMTKTLTAEPWEFGLSTRALSNGEHTLSLRARDAAGNVAESASVHVSVQNEDVAAQGCSTSTLGPSVPVLMAALALSPLLRRRRRRVEHRVPPPVP